MLVLKYLWRATLLALLAACGPQAAEPGPAVETVEAALDWLAHLENVMQASTTS